MHGEGVAFAMPGTEAEGEVVVVGRAAFVTQGMAEAALNVVVEGVRVFLEDERWGRSRLA